ncbi:TylF/MycF/NovP-related O-methyltransferase [Bosea thiooxidans]
MKNPRGRGLTVLRNRWSLHGNTSPVLHHHRDDMAWTDIADRIVEEIKPFTMVPKVGIVKTIELAISAIENGHRGDFVECGTWLGGSSFAMLLAQRYHFGEIRKPVWMLDSFQGLPPTDERDGPMALNYTATAYEPGNWDNCTAPIERVREAIAAFGFSNAEAIVVPGWFNDTIPAHKSEIAKRGISLLRADCDWYEPVHYVLTELAPFVCEEGAIIIDDYFAWDGCARAAHAFLTENDLSWRIRSMDDFHGAWMIKRAHRTGAL